MLKFSVTG